MEMQDKLKFKRKRPNWVLCLSLFCTDSEICEYNFKYCKKTKIKSPNKKAYNFLLRKKGRNWIKFMRSIDFENHIKRTLIAKWINIPEED